MTKRTSCRVRTRPCARILALLAFLALPAWAQDDGFQGDGLFSLPRAQDDIHVWRTASADIEQGKYQEGIERLHALLGRQQSGVVPVLEGVDRWYGQRAAVIGTLRDLPPEAAAVYERLTAREAGGLLRTAFVGNKPGELLALAHGFPTSQAGRRARLRLAALALERGDAATAVQHYLAALDATSPQDEAHARIERHLRLARALSEAGRTALTLTQEEEALVAEARGSLPDTRAELHWNDHYGHARRPFSVPSGTLTRRGQHAVEPYGFEANDYAVHPVGGAFGVYVSDGERVLAIDPFSRQPLWEAEGPFAREGEKRGDYHGQFNTNAVLAPAVSADVVVASLLVPSEGENARVRAFDVILKIPVRRLVAFDRITGKQLWSHYDTKNGPITRRFAAHLACGPPLIVGDTVYVASHDQTGSIAFYLAAYDLRTGEPRWRQLICSSQLEVNMFGNARFEFAASPLAIEGGVVYGTTNLGVCFAADQADGTLRWVSAYKVTSMPPTRLTHQEERAVFFANNPVVVADGVMACTPLDSEYVLGFDCQTGRLLWNLHYVARVGDDNNQVRWLLGALDDEFIVSGVGVLAIKTRSNRASLQPNVRVVRSRESLGIDPILDQPPRGALVDGKIWYPRVTGVTVFDRHGTTDAKASAMLSSQPVGNLLVTDGMVVSARRRAVEVFYDFDLLVQRAERAYRERADDPLASIEYAQLLLAQADDNIEGPTAERAAEVLRQGIDTCRKVGIRTDSPLYGQLANRLFDLSLQRADSIAKRDGERALVQLRRAREGAPNDERWLDAQRRILGLVRGAPAQIAELEQIAERLGERVVRFEQGREMPAAAYALWQIAEREQEPARAIAAWQGLLEQWRDVPIDGLAAGVVAADRIERLVARHGREAYAAIEARARQALASAKGDSRALTDVIERFPHSETAGDAVRRLMDLALAQGDLEAAVRCFRHGQGRQEPAPGLVRRLLASAKAKGNLPFAAALGARLAARFGSMPSELDTDGGKPYAEVARVETAAPPPPQPPVVRPTHRIAGLMPLVAGNRLERVPAEVVSGFPLAKVQPFFVWEGGTILRAHVLGDGSDVADPVYTIDCPRLNPSSPLHVCGETLVIVEQDRVRGIELASGRQLWTRAAGDDRTFYSLGVQAGLLQVFSEHAAASDGGRLLGLEPLTGALVYQRVFGNQEASLTPVAAGGTLWSLRPEPDDAVRVWLEEIDPLTGTPLARILLSPEVRRLLQLPDDYAVQGMLLRILSHLFVVDDLVVLAADGISESDDRPPCVVALQRDGGVRWHWRGTPRRALIHLWHRENVIAVYEAGVQPGAQILLLDARSGGRPIQRIAEVNGSLQTLAEMRPFYQADAVEDALVLAMPTGPGWVLLCRSLAKDKPAFRANVTARNANPTGTPLFGTDFVMIATCPIDGSESWLHTFSLTTGAEQRQRLPGVQVRKITALEGAIALETSEGISILGNTGTPLR